MLSLNRRDFLLRAAASAAGLSMVTRSLAADDTDVLDGVRQFIRSVANPDGSFRPGIDPSYKGTSDTGLSGIAAPAYATILSATFGWSLPYRDRTVEFFLGCQKPDGAFYPPTGSMDHTSPLAKLYNTVQSVVALRILGEKPRFDTVPVIDYFFRGKEFTKLPLYTTSFFPLYFTALGEKMPSHIHDKMSEYIIREQQEDGYLQDHVASTFHAAHYFRLVGEPTPKAGAMMNRVLHDQRDDGSWQLKEPDWDVHACFDALYILRQLADQNDARVRHAYEKATQWVLTCRKADGGFAHFPTNPHADMDAVYFQVGSLVQSGYLKTAKNLRNEEILGWGHAMIPGKDYSCL